MATKKVAKKVAAPKPAKVAKPAKKNNQIGTATTQIKPKVTLVSFSVSAVIPTQQYGNIQPKIEVTASSIEEARACVMPVIEDLYKTYAELPLNGKEPKFLGKVTEEVKVVTPPSSAGTEVPSASLQSSSVPAGPQDVPAPVTTASSAPEAAQKPKSDAVLKAEKAISLAMSDDAVKAIQDQIEKSVKIAPEDKGGLITLCLEKRNQYK